MDFLLILLHVAGLLPVMVNGYHSVVKTVMLLHYNLFAWTSSM